MTNEKIVYKGKIVEVVQKVIKRDGKEIFFEYARRSPGTRLMIITSDNSILLTREFRHELNEYDYRLPGGKVFDTLEEYNSFLSENKDILAKATEAAKKEAKEEVGIEVEEIGHFATSKAGATIVWDLFYFIVTKYKELDKQELEHGEDIEVVKVSQEEAKAICLDGRMQEDRSVAILLRFLTNNK